jgi:hypothetical protein
MFSSNSVLNIELRQRLHPRLELLIRVQERRQIQVFLTTVSRHDYVVRTAAVRVGQMAHSNSADFISPELTLPKPSGHFDRLFVKNDKPVRPPDAP